MDMGYSEPIMRLKYWCQTVLPAVFDDSLSYYEVVCKVTEKLNELISKDNEIGEVLGTTVEQVEALQTLLESIKDGDYAELYIDQLASYIDKNLVNFVARLTKYVFPTFYYDGECWRFALDIPETWEYLNFSWIFVDDLTWHICLDY